MNTTFDRLLCCVKAFKMAGYSSERIDLMTDDELSIETTLLGVSLSTTEEIASLRKSFSLMDRRWMKRGWCEMKKTLLILLSILTMSALADSPVLVKNVAAQQRYPRNGLVDITVTLQGSAEDVAGISCLFAATNSATKAAISVAHITRNGDDVESDGGWVRKYIWDAWIDVGAVKIDDVVLTVDAFVGVQLWENGPYWAACNVGASKPEEYGYYFWWGDTVGYKRNAADNGWVSVKDETSFSFSSGNCPTYGKDKSQLQSAGYIDATGKLVAKCDAATVHLGAPWRMPTTTELAALFNNCDTEWMMRNGVSGRLVKGRGGYSSESIFLPAAGYGYDSTFDTLSSCGCYWSSTPYSLDSSYAWSLDFYPGYYYSQRDNIPRRCGLSVRPVRGFTSPSAAVGGATTHLSLDCSVGTVSVTSVTAQQRYPWNGLVDVTVTLQGSTEDVAGVNCLFAATNSATKMAISVEHITQNGDDTGSGTSRTRKFVWDAKADIGAVKIDDVELTVDVELPYVQLWENGPYWAECNVGATKPEEYGYYFWWGDTVGYKLNANNDGWISVKDSTGFSFSEDNCPTFAKNKSQLLSAGYIDATGNLVAAHDAATAHLGLPWRMPTDAEFSALINNCTTTWTTRNGVNGRLVTGRGAYASKSIFLPAAGDGAYSDLYTRGSYGYCWSSTPDSDRDRNAWYLSFFSSNFYREVNYRFVGQSVRPVRRFTNGGVSAGTMTGTAVTTILVLDCREGGREISAAGEDLRYDASWYEDGCYVRITDNGELIETGSVGTKHWAPVDSECHHLQMTVVDGDGIQVGSEDAYFVSTASVVVPIIEGDEGATVTGDAETGFVIKPSEGKAAVEVTIPQGVDAAKVTVEVSPKVESVKPNGAKVKIVSGGSDITEFLNVPAADGNGVVDLTKTTVKEEIVKEAMDAKKGAVIELNAANPSLTTPNTRKGLFYQLREGTMLNGMKDGDSKVGDGQPWSPEITVKGGNAAFYSIGVGKGE